MSSILDYLPQLPVAPFVENVTAELTQSGRFFFQSIQLAGNSLTDGINAVLQAVPPGVFLLLLLGLA